MAKIYYDKLIELVDILNLQGVVKGSLAVKHFFSGAALYIDNVTCVTWSPVGLAFKLSEKEINKLIKSGKATPLKYFPKGHIKKDYALFANPELVKPQEWKKYFKAAAKLT